MAHYSTFFIFVAFWSKLSYPITYLWNFQLTKKIFTKRQFLNHQKAEGQDVQDFRQYLRKNTTRQRLCQGGQGSQWPQLLPCWDEYLNCRRLGDYRWVREWNRRESLAQEAEWPTETWVVTGASRHMQVRIFMLDVIHLHGPCWISWGPTVKQV